MAKATAAGCQSQPRWVRVEPSEGVGVGVEEYTAESLFEQPTRNDTSRLRITSRHRTNTRESDFGFIPNYSRLGLTGAWRWRYECVMDSL